MIGCREAGRVATSTTNLMSAPATPVAEIEIEVSVRRGL